VKRAAAKTATLAACVVTIAGCAVGPNYQRPDVAVPETTRGQFAAAEAASLADLPWWDVFTDPQLRRLLDEAIAANHDLKAAASRVEQARNLVAVARSDMFPQLGYTGDAARQRTVSPLPPGDTGAQFNSFLASFNLAWELDVWGRIRRSTEAARADLMAAEYARRAVLLTLISDVAQNYFDLLQLDRSLEITKQTATTFRDTADLFDRRYQGGIGTLLEVSRVRALLAEAEAAIPLIETNIVVRENQLSILLGRLPGDIDRGIALEVQPAVPDVPVGIPSDLLVRRPDVLHAEQEVVAANADVGIAVASFFPRLGLSSLYGGQSSELESIVKGSANVWAVAGTFTGPIFQGGRLTANRRAALARREETIDLYRQIVLEAFAEVSGALVEHEKLKGIEAKRQEAVEQLQISVSLSLQRYRDGISSYLEVLEAQQELFPAQLELARTQRNRLVAIVSLYRALGGGWNSPESVPAVAPDAAASTDSAKG